MFDLLVIYIYRRIIFYNFKVFLKVSEVNLDVIKIWFVFELFWLLCKIMVRILNYYMFIRVGIICYEYVLKFKELIL